MEKIKVSVIIPVYNSEKYIAMCLKSLEEQTLQELDILLVNDGSTDRTVEIVQEFQEKSDLDIKVIHQENSGQAAARNRGIECADGKYLAFMDSDDYVDKEYLKKMFETAEKYDSDLVSCGYRLVDVDGNVMREVSISPFEAVSDFGRAGVFTVWSKMYRREFIQKHHFEFPIGGKIYEDVPFSLETKYNAKNPKALAYIGYNYVQRPGSTMSSGAVKSSRFPYEKMHMAAEQAAKNLGQDYRARFEFELTDFYAGFLFLYCRRCEKNDLYQLCRFALKELREFFPEYYRNEYLKLGRSKELSFTQRTAVRVFAFAARFGILWPLTLIITRF